MRLSIKRRLLILTAATVSIVVTAMAFLVWWQTDRSLRRDLDQLLRSEAAAIAGRVEWEHGHFEFQLESDYLGGPESKNDIAIQVFGDKGLIFSTPSIRNYLGFSESLHDTFESTMKFFDSQLPGGSSPYRVVALQTKPVVEDDQGIIRNASQNLPTIWVFIARSTEQVRHTSRQLAESLTIAILLAIGAAILIGFYVAHIGVRPVTELAEAIAKVEPGAPILHIDNARVPTELDPIIVKTSLLLDQINAEFERQKRLTADVAHDLRTPIAGVRTLLDVCLQNPRDEAEYRETIGSAKTALSQCTVMLENTLMLARLDADSERPVLSKQDIGDTIGESVAMIHPLAVARGIQVATADMGPFEIVSDRLKLIKALTNLVSNAVEHSPSGSVVRIEVESDDERIRIHVRDGGPGVRPGDRDRIFDRFYRADGARATNGGHNGLGLPIARGIARLLGGDVYLDWTYQQGSDFVLELPRNHSDAGKHSNPEFSEAVLFQKSFKVRTTKKSMNGDKL